MASRSTQSGTRSLIAAAALLLLTACPSIHYIPVDVENITIFEEERASSRTADLGLTVAHERLDWVPAGISGQVLAFEIALRNYGDSPIALRPEYFLLLDGEGNQYSPVTAEQLQGLLQRDVPRFGVGVGIGRYDPWHYGPGWRHHYGYYGGYPYGYGYDGRAFRELFGRSLFPASPLEPQARQRGLIFFRGDIEGRDPIYLHVRIPGQEPVRIPFTMIRR
jgi:hypothetical protein